MHKGVFVLVSRPFFFLLFLLYMRLVGCRRVQCIIQFQIFNFENSLGVASVVKGSGGYSSIVVFASIRLD